MSTVYYLLAPGQPAFTDEAQSGAWVRQFAFGALEPTAQLFHAEFTQLANAYQRPNYTGVSGANINGNIVYSNYFANTNINGRIAYFCDDLFFNDLRGNLQTWTREVATLPANFSDYETYPYTFPGYFNGRAPFTDSPTSKLQKDFFLIGNVTLGANYATPADIPHYNAQNFAWAYYFGPGGFGFGWDPSNITIADGYLGNTNANLGIVGSVPNLNVYQGWVANDNANGTFTIEAAPSAIEHWRGPIWMRTRRFVRAV